MVPGENLLDVKSCQKKKRKKSCKPEKLIMEATEESWFPRRPETQIAEIDAIQTQTDAILSNFENRYFGM